jgi:prepilin-type N-terminal cleavage/methylation domain-containing protein
MPHGFRPQNAPNENIVQTHFRGHNVGAMHPRTLGRPPRRTLVGSTSLRRYDPGAVRQPAKNHPCEKFAIAESRALRRRDRAFTLIELLVVMAIIAILIGLFLPTLFGFYERAKKVQAKNDLTQIVNAVNAFYTEYGKYPLATDDSTITNNANLFYTLRAVANGANAGDVVNPRKIVFISPRVLGTAPVRSAIASDNGQFYDPWQTPYRVAINGTYDNQLANPYTADTGAGPVTLNIGVIAWSFGKNVTQGTDFNASDDVISWQ